MAKIVVVEDDVDIRRMVADVLSSAGNDVESADTALGGLELIVQARPDLAIMDLGLPDMDGADLLRMVRAVSDVPVMVITARGADESVVKILDAGADDYLIKPFSVTQLEARIRAILRRGASSEPEAPLTIGDLVVDRKARAAHLEGRELDLSPKEFELLALLADRKGEVVTKRELLAEVWREPYGGSERTVDVHLSWLRKKLGETATEPRYLKTVHGVGVKLVRPDQ